MDTKAKVLLGAGALVLAGMVVYVLVPGGKKHVQEAEVTETVATSEPATAPTTEPATTQADPFAAPTTNSTTAFGNTANANDPWAVLDTGGPARHNTMGMTGAGLDNGTSSSATETPKTYKVSRGETLASISTKVFGSAKYSSKIAAANPKVNTKSLKPGVVLKLPEITPAAPAVTVSGPETSHTDSAIGVGSGKTYTVVAGDTLRKISSKNFGTQAMWEKIYELNKSKIGSDPGKLKRGMVLQLPEATASR